MRFTVTGNAGQLNVLEALTDSSGVARVTFTAGTTAGNVAVSATADGVAQPASVSIQVKVNPYGTLNIAVSSVARIAVPSAEVWVFRGAADVVPTCAALEAAELQPTAAFAADFTQLPSQRSFAEQPHGSTVTARAVGYNAQGVAVATACNEGIAIVGGQTANTALQLVQLPTQLEGDYDVRLEVDLGNALPEPYDTYVSTTSNILADPAGYAAYQALRAVDEQFGTSFVYWNGPDGTVAPEVLATYEEVVEQGTFTTWSGVRDAIDWQLELRLGQRYVNIKTVGGDIRNALTEFEVGSRFTLTRAPNTESGYDVSEKWNDLVLEWRFGCPDGDMACARRLIALDDTNYAPVATEYGALASLSSNAEQSERFAIATEPHLFALRYGAIVLVAMNELVFPSLSNGEATDLQSMLSYLIDCEAVGEAIFQNLGIPAGQGESLCLTGLGAAADIAEGSVLAAQLGGDGDPQLDPKEQQGALGGGTFYLLDESHDLVADRVRDLSILVQWNDPEGPAGLSQDISAPIVGDGRRMATGCDSDAACEAGFFCTPLPHYMQVAGVEPSCERPVGATLGEAPCTGDAECTTGMCVGATDTAPGTCFSACVGPESCGSGICVTDGANKNLEEMLPGLGDVPLDACMPE